MDSAKMSETYLTSIAQGMSQLLKEEGVNEKAAFQTRQRNVRFPGPSLAYTFSVLPVAVNKGIATPDDSSHHSDIVNTVDGDGFFHITDSYVGASQRACEEYKRMFAKARARGQHLVLIEERSYLNRRLRAGFK